MLILTHEAKTRAWIKSDIGRLTANELRFLRNIEGTINAQNYKEFKDIHTEGYFNNDIR